MGKGPALAITSKWSFLIADSVWFLKMFLFKIRILIIGIAWPGALKWAFRRGCLIRFDRVLLEDSISTPLFLTTHTLRFDIEIFYAGWCQLILCFLRSRRCVAFTWIYQNLGFIWFGERGWFKDHKVIIGRVLPLDYNCLRFFDVWKMCSTGVENREFPCNLIKKHIAPHQQCGTKPIPTDWKA